MKKAAFVCMISLDSVKTKYLFWGLWCRQGFIGLKANLQLHSHSLTSAHFSPSFSCGKNNKQSGHCWYCGAFPLFPSSADSEGGNLHPFKLQKLCYSHSRSAPKGLCSNAAAWAAGWWGKGGAGHPALWPIPAWGSLFSFSSAFIKSAR